MLCLFPLPLPPLPLLPPTPPPSGAPRPLPPTPRRGHVEVESVVFEDMIGGVETKVEDVEEEEQKEEEEKQTGTSSDVGR